MGAAGPAGEAMKADLPEDQDLIVHTRRVGILDKCCWYHPTLVRCEKCPDDEEFLHRDDLLVVRDYPGGGGYTAE